MGKFMLEALKEAKKAGELGEVPVGAVVVLNGQIVGRGHNLTETEKDPTAHGEIVAIKAATKLVGRERLCGCELYVTVEPCIMCAGAIVQARIGKVVIGTADSKGGAFGSVIDLRLVDRLNHYPEVEFGCMEAECKAEIQGFFKGLRQRQKEKKLLQKSEDTI